MVRPNLPSAPRPRRAPRVLLLSAFALACDVPPQVRTVIGGDPAAARWTSDSLLLATSPDVLFRVRGGAGAAEVVPIAMLGANGPQPLRLSGRGWRDFDAAYLHTGRQIVPVQRGASVEPVRMFRGMWQPGATPLDSLPCPVSIPIGQAIAGGNGGGTSIPPLATSRRQPPLRRGPTLSEGEIARALQDVATLVAPQAGVTPAQLPRYSRRAHQVPSGIDGGSTLLVEYNDRTPLPDSGPVFNVRPRQLIVAIDRGAYGFRPTLTYSTSGARGAPLRLSFLDYVDLDADGVPELVFGASDEDAMPLYTVVYRYESAGWREVFRFTGNRCDT